jgi:hypothetical protein
MDVTNVAGNDVTIDLGAGDVLPAATTAIVVTPRIELDTDFDADELEAIAASCNRRAHIEFLTEGDASIEAVELTANEAWQWFSNQGTTNPLAGNIVGKVQMSCGDGTNAGTFKLGVLYDSTP